MDMDSDQSNTMQKALSTGGFSISPLALTLGGLALMGLILFLLQWAAPVVTPVFFALYLTAILSPVYRWLMGKGLKKGPVLLLLITGILAAGTAVALLAATSVQGLRTSLPTYDSQLTNQVEALLATVNSNPEMAANISDFLSALLAQALVVSMQVAGNFVFSAVLTSFLLLELDRFRGLAVTEWRDRPIFDVLPAVMKTAVRYFGIRTRLNFITGISMVILCVLLDVDYPLLWGLWAFLLSYIPYIGLATAMIPPALLAWAESGPLAALILIVGITVLNLTIENVLEPSYTGKKLQLSPAIVFVSFFFWGWLLGAMGALLSMPITVLLLLTFSASDNSQWLAHLFGRFEP
jgi:AI-2 transport protein TqsA